MRERENLSNLLTNMDILFSGLGDLFPNEFKNNLTVSTLSDTGETGDRDQFYSIINLLKTYFKKDRFASFSTVNTCSNYLVKGYRKCVINPRDPVYWHTTSTIDYLFSVTCRQLRPEFKTPKIWIHQKI